MFRIILHYRRSKKDYAGWCLHIWGPTLEYTTWQKPLNPFGEDEYGIYWVIRMLKGAENLNFIIHRGNEKDGWKDQELSIQKKGREVWLIQSDNDGNVPQFLDQRDAIEVLNSRGIGDIKGKAQAYWLDRSTIAWHIGFHPDNKHGLYYSTEGGIEASPDGIINAEEIPLNFIEKTLPANLAEKYPHLKHAAMFQIPKEYLSLVPDILKGQSIIAMYTDNKKVRAVSALQIPWVLDDLYAYHGRLGVVFNDNIPTLRVWAPTAKNVKIHLYRYQTNNFIEIVDSPFQMNYENGIWEIEGYESWTGLYYLYEVNVYARQEGCIVQNLVTDPYSFSLSQNSLYSQIVDLHDPALIPNGWEEITQYVHNDSYIRRDPVDMVIYELHMRDFSSFDYDVKEELRGTYLAFYDENTNGMKHLKRLANAGMTHIHLLPVFDFATVDEDKGTWIWPDFELLATYPPNSYKQQAVLARSRDKDGYNWGYDPYHYMTPEGSYALETNGSRRILEFRKMVLALFRIGLRVIMDVVFNHTYADGQSEKSVLDRIVPGYYYRMDNDGQVITSTCCPNTASEHFMMEKLMIDSLLLWAVEYQVNGFRFDLMGHHLKSNMIAIRQALDELAPGGYNVDGKSIYIYGEGWDFGEMMGNARGINASQWNMQGTGIGTFNDRVREAIRGGGPFTGKKEQGFVTGLFTDSNEDEHRSLQEQLAVLNDQEDRIKIGLAGNLINYEIMDARGMRLKGYQISSGCGYTKNPQENVCYTSAHDNETLFDAIQYKAPISTPISERIRMQNLAISFVALSQGVPFFDAGCELLRSKSLDRNSYNSGDWFNKIDFSYNSNNWGVGLPSQKENDAYWPIMQDLLGRRELSVTKQNILNCLDHFEETIRIRMQSPLFRLRNAGEILDRIKFFNQGTQQIPGLIIMGISDMGKEFIDKNYDFIVVFFNTNKIARMIMVPELNHLIFDLHPILQGSNDPIVRLSSYDINTNKFYIPGRTTSVFVHNRI